MTMPEPDGPWPGPRRPEPGGGQPGVSAAQVATTTVEHPGCHVTLPALPIAARWARRRGGEILREWEVDEDAAASVSLLISELVPNALRHGLPATLSGAAPVGRCGRCGGPLCLKLRREPRAVLLEAFARHLAP